MAFLSKGNEPRGLRLFTTGSSLASGGLGAQTIPRCVDGGAELSADTIGK
jgi:hypothetical protein